MPDDYHELRDAVAEANRGVAAAGLVVQAFGNASEVDRGSFPQATLRALGDAGLLGLVSATSVGGK